MKSFCNYDKEVYMGVVRFYLSLRECLQSFFAITTSFLQIIISIIINFWFLPIYTDVWGTVYSVSSRVLWKKLSNIYQIQNGFRIWLQHIACVPDRLSRFKFVSSTTRLNLFSTLLWHIKINKNPMIFQHFN